MDDRWLPGNRWREESPGSNKRWYWLTARRPGLKVQSTESATESKPPGSFEILGKGERVR